MAYSIIIGRVFLRKKIPCYVLIFYETAIIKESLNFLSNYSDRLDLIIIENPSPNTREIKYFVNKLGARKLIKRYYLFDKNITNNAFDVVISRELERLKKSPFLILTDGDMTSKNTGWLDEELAILRKNRDIFAAGVSLDKSNLPIRTFPEARRWIPEDIRISDEYYEAYTGAHLLMMRGRDLYNFMAWKQKNNRHFIDGDMHVYCYEVLDKKWARTKNAVAYHLTWDLYNNKDHPYTILKTKKSFNKTWYHSNKSGYTLKEF